jgi:hypothetical protein
MPKVATHFIALLLVLAAGVLVIRPAPVPRPQHASPPTASTLHSSFAAYDTFGPGWETTLLLNNTTIGPVVLNLIVYAANGTSATLPPVSLAAHEHKRIPFGTWIAPLGPNFEKGSLELDFKSVLSGIGAILSSVNLERSLAVDVVLHGASDFNSSRMDGLYYAPRLGATVPLAVSNTTAYPVRAFVSAASAGGNQGPERVLSLAPHQSSFLDLEKLTADQPSRSGAISMHHDGAPGAVLIQGAVLDTNIGFSYNIPFADPKTFADAKFAGAGIFLGQSDDHADADNPQFTGKLLLRNISAATLSANPFLQRGTEISNVESVTLQPGETREVTVSPEAAPFGDGAIGIQIPYNGKPGELIAQWFSVDQTGSLVVDTPLRSPSPTEHFGGSNPFYLAGDFTSTTYIKNTGNSVGHIIASIQYQGGRYMIGEKQIDPGETLAIDIRKLRDGQVPDQNGQRLPRDLVLGQINWQWHDGPAIVGRTNVMSVSLGIAANRSCPTCGCFPYDVQWAFNAGNQTLVVGQTFNFSSVTETDISCNGLTQPSVHSASTSGASWQSSNTSVATVDSSGNVTAVGPGSAIISVSSSVSTSTIPEQGSCGIDGTCPTCPFVSFPVQAQAQVTVQVPTSLRVLADTKVIDMGYAGHGCTNNSSWGILIAIHYQVLDQNGASIPSILMEPQEEDPDIGLNGWGDIGPSNYPGTSKFTDANGQFWDAPLGRCSNVGPLSGTDTQYISILLNGGRYPVNGAVRTNQWSTSSSFPGHGSISNGTDVSKSR